MLNLLTIQNLTKEIKIAPLNVIREYLEMETLHYLSQSALAKQIIFYGGTSIRLAYQGLRFSEDLDFNFIKPPSKQSASLLAQTLQNVVEHNSGVVIEEIIQKRWTLFGLLHITHALLKHPIRIKLELSKRSSHITSHNVLLTSPTTNKEVIFKTIDLGSLLQLKAQAMHNRMLPRDWFDYWYICQKLHCDKTIKLPFPFQKNAFKNDLKRWLPQSAWNLIDSIITFYD